MNEQHYRSRGNPVHTDDEIIGYYVNNPEAPSTYVRKEFNCAPQRAADLKAKALKLIDSTKRTKKKGVIHWEDFFRISEEHQQLKGKSSWSQDSAIINIWDKYKIDKPIVIQAVSDTHIGSIATNYQALREITHGVLNTPNLFWILNGDLTETTVVFKNALAVHSQTMGIEEQHDVLESWLDTIAPKVLCAGWDNHGIEREERFGAFSHIKRLLNRRFIYHNGIGEITIEHGKANYKVIVSHKISGYSIFNQLHGAKRLMRLQFPDADICLTGDKHTPDIETYYEGKFRRGAMMGGSFKIDCGYSKRYFSLYTHMDMPAMVLYPDEKYFSLHMNAMEALAVANNLKEVPRF